jgi:hypothetical protein
MMSGILSRSNSPHCILRAESNPESPEVGLRVVYRLSTQIGYTRHHAFVPLASLTTIQSAAKLPSQNLDSQGAQFHPIRPASERRPHQLQRETALLIDLSDCPHLATGYEFLGASSRNPSHAIMVQSSALRLDHSRCRLQCGFRTVPVPRNPCLANGILANAPTEFYFTPEAAQLDPALLARFGAAPCERPDLSQPSLPGSFLLVGDQSILDEIG